MEDQYGLSGSLCEYDNKKSKTGKERYFSLENNLLNCFRKKKEMIENKYPKYSLDIQECKNIKLEKGKHDNILCIEHKDRTFFLIATRKEDINRWYHVLSRLCNNSDGEQRPRLRTQPTTHRNWRTEPTQQHLSSPSFDNFLNDTIKYEAQRRPLPNIPEAKSNVDKGSEANASNIDIQVLRELPCCVKHHLVQDHPNGKNIVDTETIYENIHFIRSRKEWREKAEITKRNLQVNKDSYKYASALSDIQEPSELVCEEHKDLEPIYMNTRPVSIVNQPPPPIERAVPTQPPPLPIRQKIKQNEKGPATAPKPPVKPKPKPRKKPDDHCANTDDSVRELVRQQGKSVRISIPKQVLIDNKIKLAEINNGIWFGGFEHNCPEKSPSDCILFGDQLVYINDQWLDSAKFAGNIIQTARRQEVSLCVKRLPHAQIITIRRDYEQQRLGLECHRREITNVSPDEIASTQGRLRPEATGISGMNCNWTITHLNSSPIPPNITTEMMEEKLKMAGKTVHLIVQPTDFVKEITDTRWHDSPLN